MTEKKILLTKQTPEVIEALRVAFNSSEYLVEMASTASEMLAHVFMGLPDLVVLNGNPKESQNAEVLRTIRANSATNNIPALVILSDDTPEIREQFDSAGACDFVIQPFTPERIKSRVESLIKGRNLFGSRLNSRIVTFCGTKGGSGVTTLATNIAIDLIEYEQSVLLLELANYFSGIKPSLNIKSRNSIPFMMSNDHDGLTSERVLSFIHEHETGIKTIPAITGIADMEKMDAKTVEFMRYHLCPIADFTIFDAGYGLDEASLELFDISSMVIFVATLDIMSLYNLELIAQIFEGTRLNLNKCFVVFNHTHHQGEIAESTINEIKGKIPTLGFVPNHSAGFLKALNRSKPYLSMFPKSPAAKAIRSITDKITKKLLGEEKAVTAA